VKEFFEKLSVKICSKENKAIPLKNGSFQRIITVFIIFFYLLSGEKNRLVITKRLFRFAKMNAAT